MRTRALLTLITAVALSACGPELAQPRTEDRSGLEPQDAGATCVPDGGSTDGGCTCTTVIIVVEQPDAGAQPADTAPLSGDDRELSGGGCGATHGGIDLVLLLLVGLALARKRAWMLGLLPLALSASARAQTAPQPARGFAVNRFDPAARGSGWFAADDLELQSELRPTLGLGFDLADSPLVTRSLRGGGTEPIISRQLIGHFGASFVFARRVRFDASLPVALDTEGGAAALSNRQYAPSGGVAPGDMRLAADVRLLGEADAPLTVALGLRLYAPTGSPAAFTGDGRSRAGLRAAAAGALGHLRYAVAVTGLARTSEPGSDAIPLGSGAQLAAAVGWETGRVRIGPELLAATDRSPNAPVSISSAPSAEALLGAHVQLGPVRVGLGAGPGLSRGVGTPSWRGLASIDWSPAPEAPPVRDSDGDGIVDARDACPEVRGEPDRDPSRNGCPHPPPDRDHDGIPDADDACPDEPGPLSSLASRNGCPLPPPDRDGDGVPDAQDACPDKPGLADGDPKLNGCPPPDRDGDGVPDAQDECPDKPGSAELGGCPGTDRDGDGVPDRLDNCPAQPGPASNQGCPESDPQRVALTRERIVLREPVLFVPGTARLEQSGEPVLDQVVRVLKNHPELVALVVEGHADEPQSGAANQKLSELRAATVARYLAHHGVASTRLQQRGYGAERPLAPSEGDPVARQQNGRVELRIFATVR